MTKGVFFQAVFKMGLGMAVMGLLLFLPAGTMRYGRAWLLLGVLFVPMLLLGILLAYKNPELLKKRLQSKEKQVEQKRVVKLSGAMFVLGFAVAGLDFRYDWSILPLWVSWVAAGFFLLSYLLYAEVLRENVYLSRTIEVQENQRVIDTGLYGVVRHPMYAATLLLFLSMPLVLGSLISVGVFLVYPLLIAKRIYHEEQILEKELDGYAAYRKKVKYKLIPFVW